MLSARVRGVRKHRRKRIVFLSLAYRPPDGGRRSAEIVAKVYGSDRGATAYDVLGQLWSLGFRPPAKWRVPRPYGYSASQGTLLLEEARGRTWADHLSGVPAALRGASARAADWLVQLQHSQVRAGAAGHEEHVATVCRLTGELQEAYPLEGERVHTLAQRLVERLVCVNARFIASHGDYHPKNVILARGYTTVIDFDTFGLREPGYDVGYAIGQLLIMSRFRLGDFCRGAEGARAFWNQYQKKDGEAVWPEVAAYVARTFLESLHFELCTLRNNREELLLLWLDMMAKWLDSRGMDTLEDLIRHR